MKEKQINFISPGKILAYLTNSIVTYDMVISEKATKGIKEDNKEMMVALAKVLKEKDEKMISKIKEGDFFLDIAEFITTLDKNNINLADLFVIPDQTNFKISLK